MAGVSHLHEAVSHLSAAEKAELALYLLDDLEPRHHQVSDAEVLERKGELDSGKVRGLTLEAFRKACGR